MSTETQPGRVFVPSTEGFDAVEVELVEQLSSAVTVRCASPLPTGVTLGFATASGELRLVRRQRLPSEPDGEYHLRDVPPDTI